jgi:glycosyltransferase involved in cell wall biosynthesis
LRRHPERKFFPKFLNVIKTRRRLEACRELKKIIAPSRYIKNELIKHGFRNEQVTVLPPYAGERLGFQVKNLTYNNNIVLFAGRIVRYKGVDVLLKALSLVRCNFEAWIIGEGGYRKKCEHISKKLNLQNKVKFLGWVDNDNLHNFYSKATLVAVPSVCAESHVMVGVEAMSYGRPVVAFDVGGISDWLENGETGFLVKLMDYRTFADKITLLLTNKSLAEEMGMNGYKKYLVKFNKINYIERLIEIFQSVM